VQDCAHRLGGTARLATIEDKNTPNTGVVRYVDEDKHARQIDFLGAVAGVENTHETSIGAEVLDKAGQPVATFRVMHPVLCLLSRAHNVAYLPGYNTPHARNQLRAAIICAKQFIRDMLQDDAKAALNFNKKLLREAGFGASLVVYVRYGIDVLEAVVTGRGTARQVLFGASAAIANVHRPAASNGESQRGAHDRVAREKRKAS
jgi:hypothetical protein